MARIRDLLSPQQRQTRRLMAERIESLRGDLDEAIQGYLSFCGWHHTSNTPDCVWRWQKNIDNTVFLTTQADAVRIQGALDG